MGRVVQWLRLFSGAETGEGRAFKSRKTEQRGEFCENVLHDLIVRFFDERGLAHSPFETLDLVGKHTSYRLHPRTQEDKEVVSGFLTCDGANDHKTAELVIAGGGQHKSRATFGLFSSDLGVEVDRNDIPEVWNVGCVQSITSAPTSPWAMRRKSSPIGSFCAFNQSPPPRLLPPRRSLRESLRASGQQEVLQVCKNGVF